MDNPSHSTNRCATVPTAGGTFSPLRTRLRLDNHAYSPTVLKMVSEAMGRLHSAEQATFALKIAKITISSRHVQRLAQELGNEMARQRDDKVIQQRWRELPARVSVTPEVVAAEVDGGHLRTRAEGCGPGVHEVQGKEEKVACLMTLNSPTLERDPEPEPPPSFLQPRRVRRLVIQMKGSAGEDTPDRPEDTPDRPANVAAEEEPTPRPPPGAGRTASVAAGGGLLRSSRAAGAHVCGE